MDLSSIINLLILEIKYYEEQGAKRRSFYLRKRITYTTS